MVSVASLLNPVEEVRPLLSQRESHIPGRSFLLSLPPYKKPKVTEDAAFFAEGKVCGEIRYPPFEEYNQETFQELQRFSLYPLKSIAKYHRHIPYDSKKQTLWERTGRGAFEGR